MQRLRDGERLDRAGGPVHVALARQQAAVEQHAHRLDGVERNTLGPVQDVGAKAVRQPRDEAVQQGLHRASRERLERERRRVARAACQAGKLGPRQREDEDRMAARPVEQVVDEVDQAGLGPLEVLEDEHARAGVGEPFEEQAPGREELLPVGLDAVAQAEQVGEPRLEPRALVGVGDVGGQAGAQLEERLVRRLLLADPRPHAHHLRERPVGDALAVGETPAAVPPDLLDEAVDVLLELPREPRLADAGDADRRDEVRAPLLGRRVEELLHEAQLALAADERRLEALRAERPAPRGGHPHGAPELAPARPCP